MGAPFMRIYIIHVGKYILVESVVIMERHFNGSVLSLSFDEHRLMKGFTALVKILYEIGDASLKVEFGFIPFNFIFNENRYSLI